MRAHRRSPAAAAVASLVTEREWQAQVTQAAELLGWQWCHWRPGRTEHGWRTPVSGPLGKGWPDITLARDRVIFAELKAGGARLTPEQQAVHDALRQAGATVHVWRPSDLPAVLEALR